MAQKYTGNRREAILCIYSFILFAQVQNFGACLLQCARSIWAKIYLFYMLEYVEIYINRRRAVFFIKMVECAENIFIKILECAEMI